MGDGRRRSLGFVPYLARLWATFLVALVGHALGHCRQSKVPRNSTNVPYPSMSTYCRRRLGKGGLRLSQRAGCLQIGAATLQSLDLAVFFERVLLGLPHGDVVEASFTGLRHCTKVNFYQSSPGN